MRDERLNYAIGEFRKAMLINHNIKKGVVMEPFVEYKKNLRACPDTKLLKRERKVVNRLQKEKIRRGTKNLTTIKSKLIEIDVSAIVNKIICGDSENILKELPDNFVDIIVTSPPYNFGLEYKDDKNIKTLCTGRITLIN